MGIDVFGAIVPHPPIIVEQVGGRRASVTQATIDSMQRVAAALEAFGPETLVLMSPHAPIVTDAFAVLGSSVMSGDLGQFGAPGARVDAQGDPELAGAIFAAAEAEGLAMIDRADMYADMDLDHGAVVPLTFLHRDPSWRLVVLSLGKFGYEQHRVLGTAVRRAAGQVGRRVAFIASGDLSHRLTPDAPAGYTREGAIFDSLVVEHVMNGDLAGLAGLDPDLIGHAGECGLRSIVALSGFLQDTGAKVHLLAYEGPWGVGYMTAVAAAPEVVDAMPGALVRTGAPR